MRIMTSVDLAELAEEIGWEASSKDVLEFILNLDACVSEQGFTVELIQKLQETLEED